MQHDMPCMTPDGKIIMEHQYKVSRAPNGNGGIYLAIYESGTLDDMKRRGVEEIFVYGVDNILVRVADPVFVGFFVSSKADCAAKVVPKSHAKEGVGVLVERAGKPAVVEYSEIDPEKAAERDANGQLVLNTGNICIHMFSLDFLYEVVKTHLPSLSWHVAAKKITAVNADGVSETPKTNNGWKFELFIFDIFPCSSNYVALEVTRNEEFSPLKNAPGSKEDSPDTCREHVTALNTTWLKNAGAIIEQKPGVVEISPLVSYAGENLQSTKNIRVSPPFHLSKL